MHIFPTKTRTMKGFRSFFRANIQVINVSVLQQEELGGETRRIVPLMIKVLGWVRQLWIWHWVCDNWRILAYLKLSIRKMSSVWGIVRKSFLRCVLTQQHLLRLWSTLLNTKIGATCLGLCQSMKGWFGCWVWIRILFHLLSFF